MPRSNPIPLRLRPQSCHLQITYVSRYAMRLVQCAAEQENCQDWQQQAGSSGRPSLPSLRMPTICCTL